MGELGAAREDFHERIGAEARLAGIDTLLTLGELSAYTAAQFRRRSPAFPKIEELLAEVESCWRRSHDADKGFALHANGAAWSRRIES